ncbi:MAG: hypothetical protein QF609_10190, partial [Gammaproteobacteria bacterium]|nr:hypothetical protein [Gammaproteobacteria bacterium]
MGVLTSIFRRANAALFSCLCVVALGACSGVNTRTADGQPIRMTRDEFAEYVETTFRYHNRIVNELILASSLGDEDVVVDASLLSAEEDMAAICQPLNDP